MRTLIIDNYDSFTYNLYQYIGELGGNPVVYRNDEITIAEIKKRRFTHIVISPGPGDPSDPKYFGVCKQVIRQIGKTIPVLGVCLGHQGIIFAFGGEIVRAEVIKHGKQSLVEHDGKGIFEGVKNPFKAMRYHSLMGEKESLPKDLEITAISRDDRTIMGVRHKKYPIYGVQFHPESIGTEEGRKILRNFLFNLRVLPLASPKIHPQGDPDFGAPRARVTRLLNTLINRENLSINESEFLMEEMLKGKLTPSQIAAILTALRMKGETAEEILGFIKVMQKHMIAIKTEGIVVDTCGTGGDGSGSFNVSTAAALVAASCGVKVAKHGNRNASSRCGSADVLEELGVNINLAPEQAEKQLRETNFTFLFAPLYHPAMKNVALVRKELGVRTVFNFLGSYVSPARVKRQIIGVPNMEIAQKLTEVGRKLDYEHLLIVTSMDGFDEISISAETCIFEIRGKNMKKYFITPSDFGLKGKKEDLRGGDRKMNAQIIRGILEGKKGAATDAVLINAAAALYVSGKAKSIKRGLFEAKKAIDSGRARQLLNRVRYI